MKLSIVTTMYYSASYIKEFYNRITISATKITKDYEIIFVNDGSLDNSLQLALELRNIDKKVKVIDLEEDPELLNLFWDELMKENDIDVVYGVQKKGKAAFLKEFLDMYFFMYIIFSQISK